jgi:hypothetical protein
MALFRDAVANAIAAGWSSGGYPGSGNNGGDISIKTEVSATSIVSTTFKMRVGGGGGTPGLAYCKVAGSGTALFSTTCKQTILIEEVAQ